MYCDGSITITVSGALRFSSMILHLIGE